MKREASFVVIETTAQKIPPETPAGKLAGTPPGGRLSMKAAMRIGETDHHIIYLRLLGCPPASAQGQSFACGTAAVLPLGVVDQGALMSKRKNQTTTASGTVVGLFHNQADAEQAIQRLKQEGFSDNQIGVAIKDRQQQQELIEGTGTQTAEGAATGAIGGGVLGGAIGLLAGVGAVAIPGVGPIIAGGTLASTLAGAGIGAAAGGLLGALVGMGVPEEDAEHFDKGFRAGGTLVTVNAGTRAEEARDLLYEYNADLGSLGRGLSTRAGAVVSGDAEIRGDTEAWRGNERRYHHDSSYTGPERRLSRV
jgi:hypothetical protein